MIMYKKPGIQILAVYVWIALVMPCAVLSARVRSSPQNDFVTVEGDFNDNLIQIISDNANACFNNLNETYFQVEQEKPLKIYLLHTASDLHKLIEEHSSINRSELQQTRSGRDWFYVYSVPAVYTYIYSADDNQITLEPLFASIVEHFMARQFDDAPLWFRSGLISFFSTNARIDNGKFVPAGPCPRDGLVLRNEVESETRLNIKKLYISSDERFLEWPSGPHLATALFSWLYKNGHLVSYINLVKNKGYELEVLEEATGSSAGKINIDLKKYIESECCTAAYLADAQDAQDPQQKEGFLLEALKKIPDYPEAQLALARLYYGQGNYQSCQNALVPLLADPQDSRFLPAARLAAEVQYDLSNYAQARDYYQKAWDKAEDYIYKYQLAYKIANCCHYLNEPEVAAQWYKEFLELDFQSDRHPAAVSYAQKYVETFGSERN
jgi:tetratricopeptide (TPR) repeat protein